MDRPSFVEWQSLAQEQAGPCATLYLPTFPGRPEEFQDHVRLKNLAMQARQGMIDHGTRPQDAETLVQRVLSLSKEDSFWHDRNQGLAIYLSNSVFKAWRLPLGLQEYVHVGRRFQLAPILPLFTQDLLYYVLAISENQVHLYKGSLLQFEDVSSNELSIGLKESLRYVPVDGSGQVHSGALSFGKSGSIHHGQGGTPDAHRADLIAFMRQVNSRVDQVLHDANEPLLLASTPANISAFREVSTYGHLLDETLPGNVDHLSTHEIHAKSWQIVEGLIKQRELRAIEEFKSLANSDRASTKPSEIIPAAIQGRVKTLFLDQGVHLWGEFDVQSQSVHSRAEPRHGDDDLFDRAAVEAVLKHGQVFLQKPESSPSSSPIAAVFRY